MKAKPSRNILSAAIFVWSVSVIQGLEPPFQIGQPPEIHSDKPGLPLDATDFNRASKLNSAIDDGPPLLGIKNQIDPIELGGGFEGDIILNSLEEYAILTLGNETSNIDLRNAIINPERQWPKGEIPYVISSAFDVGERSLIANAIAVIHENTCVRFTPRKYQNDYIHLFKGNGCSSSVGRIGGGQVVSLGNGCFHNKGIVMHELMHTAGFWHEHSRGDRDAYIDIIYENINPRMMFNFNKYDWNTIQSLDVQYDFGSIMHYGPYAFAKDRSKPTIIPRERKEIGQRRNFSPKDLLKINILYNCSDTQKPGPLCTDNHKHCASWAVLGECEKNPTWMKKNCQISCRQCGSPQLCEDSNTYCPYWAKSGECEENPHYMLVHCQRSCHSCL